MDFIHLNMAWWFIKWAEAAFWIALILLFYGYIGYMVLLFFISVTKTKRSFIYTGEAWPAVTIVIASYNEEKVIAQKIENIQSLDYPKAQLKIIVITDGSNDNSMQLLNSFGEVEVLSSPYRKGKAAALNRAMLLVHTPFVVYSDANTLLNRDSLKSIVRHFANEKIGAVAGEKKVMAVGNGKAESWYWKYESFLKKLDTVTGTAISAAGEVFALRTALYIPLEEETILDDFTLSLSVILQGYKIEYEPGAFAIEMPSISLQDEAQRKIRMATGAFQLLHHFNYAALFKFPFFAFQFFSRKWFRWVISPVAIIVLFFSNILLFKNAALYQTLFYVQSMAYLLAFIGWWIAKYNKTFFLFTVPFYFLFMNYCQAKGFIRFKRKRHTVLWPKLQRQL